MLPSPAFWLNVLKNPFLRNPSLPKKWHFRKDKKGVTIVSWHIFRSQRQDFFTLTKNPCRYTIWWLVAWISLKNSEQVAFKKFFMLFVFSNNQNKFSFWKIFFALDFAQTFQYHAPFQLMSFRNAYQERSYEFVFSIIFNKILQMR